MFDHINMTGFQSFGDITTNPTQLIINQFTKNPRKCLLSIDKLNVTVKQVDHYLESLLKKCPKDKRILNLHFGVGPNEVYFLQTCGYNNKDFRIPDNDGIQCSKQQICHDKALDQPLKTSLDLKLVSEKLTKIGHDVELSSDPGRYLCNYIYFKSLNQFDRQGCTSLFVHFPRLEVKSMKDNLKFVNDLLDVLTE